MKSFYLEQAEKLMQNKYGSSHFLMSSAIGTANPVEGFSAGKKDSDSLPELPDLSQYEVVKSIDTRSEAEKIAFGDNTFTKTYTSFSGADMVVYVDEKVQGELSKLKFLKIEPALADCILKNSDYIDRHLVKDYPVILIVEQTLFNESMIIPDDANIKMFCANEYGQKSERNITGVKMLGRTSGMSVDSVVSEEAYILCAKDITPLIKLS